MLQRFGLIVWPDIAGEWINVDRAPNHDALRNAHTTFSYLDALDYRELGARRDQDHDGDDIGVPYLRLAPDALEVFLDWRHPLEEELRGGTLHPALESHFAKYRKLVPALALLVHLAERGQGAVTADAMNTAIAWDAYLRTHARRVYAAATNTDAIAARAIVKRIKKGDIAGEFSARDIQRKGWAMLSDRQTVLDALHLLIELGYLRQHQRETNGRTATAYAINPKIAQV
jgi:putative DNA primase/helicase